MIAHRLFLAAGILAGAMLGSLPASAADWKPFTQAEFSAAQKDGKPILVDIFAPWCPTCRAQKPILEVLLGGVLVAIGLLVATGLDKRLKTLLVDASPAWLTRLTIPRSEISALLGYF